MKSFFTISIFFLSLSFSIAQTINREVPYGDNKKKLVGKINKKGLTAKPYADWFNKNYEDYLLNDKIVSKLKDSLSKYEIKVFLGTWCGDSKSEVPKFYKLIEAVKFPKNQLEVIALDRGFEANKQSPNGEEKGLNIHRVPTFIFYKDGKEVNRIVEEPVETIERDILNITTGKRYRPKYTAANYLGKILNEKPLDSLYKKTTKLRDYLSNQVKHSGELNTLGYVLLSAKQIDKALFVFNINKMIFPYNPNVIDSYAEGLYYKKEYVKALKNYFKVLSLKPDDTGALAMIEKIKLEIK